MLNKPYEKKCEVCGHVFALDKENVYTAKEEQAPLEGLSRVAKMFSATDCPKCGCQMRLAIREPRVKDDPAVEVTEE